ncbi:hypothetical protein Tco_0465302 [Tanacetum coccineum]
MPRTMGTHDDKAESSRSKRQDNMKPWKLYCFHKFTMSFCYGKDVTDDVNLGCDGEIDDILRIRLCEAGSDEEIFTSVAWIRAFNINEPIYAELCHEFYSTYEFDKVCADDELQTKKIIKFRLGGRAHSLTMLDYAQRLGLYQAVKLEEEGFNVYFEGGLHSDEHFNTQDYWVLTEDVVRSLSALIYCRDLDTITLRDLINSKDRMGRMEIRQEAIKRMKYMHSYHWDMYKGVFEHMVGVYSVPMQGADNPPGYAQPQYDQYYQ